MRNRLRSVGAVALATLALSVSAKVADKEAARLAAELTPVGAQRAGDQTAGIPAWTGGVTQHGALSGEFPHDEKIDAEAPLFTITHANASQYADKLTEGHKELLKRFESYKMNVYPTHRNASFPDFIYKATAANAASCDLRGTDDLDGCRVGFPFPLPNNGAEVIWNHKLAWRGNAARRYNNQFIVEPDGSSQQTKIVEEAKFYYATEDNPVELKSGQGEFLRYVSQTLAPPRLAGTFILVHEKTGTGDVGRSAWIYSPGLKRIRRAPTVQYDNPYDGTDGNEFYDQVDMFNGALDRYDWKLLGKKAMFIPYDSNHIAGNTTKFKDLIRPHHLNQDLPRYELHRVWVVEASLRQGITHVFKTRRFYLDEDSWRIVAIDEYDNRDQLYKFQEGHLIIGANIQAVGTVPEIIYDFFSGRYFITAAFNEDKPYDLSIRLPDDYFTAASVQKMSTK